jgi:hypothetical protein
VKDSRDFAGAVASAEKQRFRSGSVQWEIAHDVAVEVEHWYQDSGTSSSAVTGGMTGARDSERSIGDSEGRRRHDASGPAARTGQGV